MNKIFYTLAASCALVFATGAQQEETFDLTRKPVQNEVNTYTMTSDIEVGDAKLSFKGTMLERITEVHPAVDFAVTRTFKDAVAKFGDSDMPTSIDPLELVYAMNNTFVKMNGDPDKNKVRMERLLTVLVPPTPVKVGGKWSYEVKSDALSGADMKADYTVLGKETVVGIDTVKVMVNSAETTGTAKATAVGTAWISLKDGSLVKLDEMWTNVPFPGSPAPVNAKVLLIRVPAKS